MVKQLDLPSIYKEREKNPVPERYKISHRGKATQQLIQFLTATK